MERMFGPKRFNKPPCAHHTMTETIGGFVCPDCGAKFRPAPAIAELGGRAPGSQATHQVLSWLFKRVRELETQVDAQDRAFADMGLDACDHCNTYFKRDSKNNAWNGIPYCDEHMPPENLRA